MDNAVISYAQIPCISYLLPTSSKTQYPDMRRPIAALRLIRPLYYHLPEIAFLFASCLKPFLRGTTREDNRALNPPPHAPPPQLDLASSIVEQDTGPSDTGALTAVIDIGSGSARAEIIHLNPGGGVEPVAQQVLNLNLMSHIDANGMLDPEGVAGLTGAIEDFAQVCAGYGIREVNAVGTAALRESLNALDVTSEAGRKYGIDFRIIDGYEEAAYCFIGAIHGLPVARGLLCRPWRREYGGREVCPPLPEEPRLPACRQPAHCQPFPTNRQAFPERPRRSL